MFIHIEKAEYIKDYQVNLLFNEGTEGIADLENDLLNKIFKPLKDKQTFKDFYLDPVAKTLIWPNGANFSPEYLYAKLKGINVDDVYKDKLSSRGFARPVKAKYLEDYKIEIEFNNGISGKIDLQDALKGKIFEHMKDKRYFAKFKLDKEAGTITWPNGADIAPEFLYDKLIKNT